MLKPQAESLLFAAVLLLLQPIQTEVVDPVFQVVGLTHIYPHKPRWKIEVTICKITRLTAHFVWPDV